MSKIKLSLLDKKIALFAESAAELLTDIHARNKGRTKSTSNRGRKSQKTISIPNTDIDLVDEEPSGL